MKNIRGHNGTVQSGARRGVIDSMQVGAGR